MSSAGAAQGRPSDQAESRPRVVALGGGHGLAASLSAIRLYAGHVTAIVSVADDGGSSGRLRQNYGVAPPGNLRKCLVALAAANSPWAAAFEHRFTGGELDGHALGNLVIAGLAVTTGDFASALAEVSRLLGVEALVLPATSEPVVLKACLGDRGDGSDRCVEGQVEVARSVGITQVSLVPADAQPPAAALTALAEADQVVIGPGSLFTSILAVVAVPALREALASVSAPKVFVCNLRSQQAETTGFDVAAHVDALASHGLEIDVVLCHAGAMPKGEVRAKCVEWEVARGDGLAHDPLLLAPALHSLVG